MQAKIWNYNNWITETDPHTIAECFDGILCGSGFNILGQLAYHFYPQGYTKLWLLGESHFAVHTFPEEGKTYIELSSCNEQMYSRFLTLLGDTAGIEVLNG